MASKWASRSIFICHRRQDTGHIAGRLYDRFAAVYGEKAVYVDVESARPGSDYIRDINRVIKGSRVMIVLIGQTWLRGAGSKQRSARTDIVRMEIETALHYRLNMLPVLVDSAKMPLEAELSHSIAPLTRLHAEELRHTTFRRDMSVLLETVEHLLDKVSIVEPDPFILLPGGGIIDNPEWERWRRRGGL